MKAGEKVIFFTTEPGGIMQPTWGSEERYRDMVEEGVICLDHSTDDQEPTKLYMVALATVDELYDFQLKGPR